MSQSLSNRTVEFASGTTGSMPFNLESSNSYYYPVVQTVPGELGGCTAYYLSAAATTNATSVKATAGQLYGFYCSNIHTVPYYLKFYNLAAAPTVGTSTVFMCFEISEGPGAGTGQVSFATFDGVIPFSTGLAFGVTADFADTGTTAVTASTLKINLWYK